MCHNPQQLETCMIQCLRQCSKNGPLRDVLVHNIRVGAWSEDNDGSFQKIFLLAAELLVHLINVVEVCPDSLRDEGLHLTSRMS